MILRKKNNDSVFINSKWIHVVLFRMRKCLHLREILHLFSSLLHALIFQKHENVADPLDTDSGVRALLGRFSARKDDTSRVVDEEGGSTVEQLQL